LGVPPAAQLPRRHRGRHLLLQVRAKCSVGRHRLQGLHLVRRGGSQPRLVRSPQTGIAPASAQAAAIDHIRLTRVARNTIPSIVPRHQSANSARSLRYPFRVALVYR
jgi:hypothetical protein